MPSQKFSPSLLLITMAICVLAQTVLRAQTTNQSKPSSSISGKVTVNDKAAADITVMAQSIERPSVQLLSIRARTDASGRYRLTGLSAGQYQVVALAPAMTVAETNSQPSPFGASKTVVLSAGEDADDIDVKLVRGAVITGRITDADDRPVVEQQVNFQPIDASGNPMRSMNSLLSYQMSQTDDRGVYRIYGLSAGRYRISVGSNENVIGAGSRKSYPVTYYGGTNDEAKAAIVELQEGSEATNIDIRVGRASNTFIATGRVVDADNGQPLSGVRIMYGAARQNEQFYGGFIGNPTGPRGEFRLEGLGSGRYGITLASIFDENSQFYADPLFFEVSDADVSNLELKASHGQTLSGIVVCEGSRAQELQRQITSLRIIANISSNPSGGRPNSSSSPIAADGSFRIGGVRGGRVNLYIGAFSDAALRNTTILRIERGGVDVTQGFEIQPGETVSDLRVVAGSGSGTIRGTVRVVGGDLPPNVRMTVSARREGGRPPYGSGMVDARGRFVMSNLLAGTYEVMLMVGPPQPGQRPMPPQKQTVNVTDDGEVQVDFIIDLTQKEGGP